VHLPAKIPAAKLEIVTGYESTDGEKLILTFKNFCEVRFSVDGFVKNRERIRFTLKVGINDFVFLQ